MKVPVNLKKMYQDSFKIPFFGRYIFAPMMRFLWNNVISKIYTFLGRRNEPESALLTTYSASISGLKNHVAYLEQQNNKLKEELDLFKWEMELRESMIYSVLDGLQKSIQKTEVK